MSTMTVPDGVDATEVYDRQHGTPTPADIEKPVNLSESANKAPPQAESFRVSGK